MSCSDPKCTYSYCVETRNKDKIKELEEKLSITIDALRDVDNMPCDPKYVLDRFEIINQALIKVGAR